MQLPEFIKLSDEVKAGLNNKEPIVVLESAIISHGLPYPYNLEATNACIDIIRKNNCIPAVVGVLNGALKIGLSEKEINLFSSGENVPIKTNLSNISIVLNSGKLGATTVSATMLAAHLCGIKVFVTGGIGGVHKGFDSSFDISSDLFALSKYKVAVVCAGCKSFLDYNATLEFLETYGVPVVGYRTKYFPLFYTKESEASVDTCIVKPRQASAIMTTHFQIASLGGVLVVCPIPDEHSIPKEEIEEYNKKSLIEIAKNPEISHRDVTPFILSKMGEYSNGKTIQSNIELIKNNAHIGSQIATSLYQN